MSWRSLVAVGLGLMLALALDQTTRLFVSPEPIVEGPRYLRTVQYHPILGWSGYPNLVETNDGIRIQTNSLGYRDREPVDAANDMLRVLFLGDSFTWGDEVRLEDRFTSLLEASCGLVCDLLPPIHAINKGVIAYGTAQSFLQYLLTRHEHRFDLVVLALFTGNDLDDNAVVDSHSGPRPRLIRCNSADDNHRLCLEGVPVPPVVDWPEHRLVNPRGEVARAFGWSGLVALASHRRPPQALLGKWIASHGDEMFKALPFPMIERTSEGPIEDRIGQMEAILAGFDRTVREDGKAFGVLLFPSARVYASEADDELREYLEIREVLARLHIPFADYYEKTKDAQLMDLFFDVQSHWRPSGHQQAAELLRQLLLTLRAGRNTN
jgi:hypothetical protein